MVDGRGGGRPGRLSHARALGPSNRCDSSAPVSRGTFSLIHFWRFRLLAAVLAVFAPSAAHAQLYEAVGIRAQGMAGAFVAVADDATTTWWNPAGLATGPIFNGIIEQNTQGASADRNLGVSFALPSLGVSFYRLRISETAASGSTDSLSGDRQDQGTTGTRLPTHVLSQLGVTVGQSLGEHLVLGSTLKLVLADQARGDLDLGAMARFGAARVAVVLKNAAAADLTAEGRRVANSRQVRVGGAYVPESAGAVDVVIAFDADLTRTATAVGDERRVAGGVEVGLAPRVRVRGGVGVNTARDARHSFSGGASASLPKGLYLDGQITRGDDEAIKGWGFALRVMF